jgi:hypothetical protein
VRFVVEASLSGRESMAGMRTEPAPDPGPTRHRHWEMLSFVHLAHLEWQASWECHRLGWLLAALVVLQIPYRIHGLRHPGQPLIPARGRDAIIYLLIGLLVGNWVIDMF